MNASILSSTAGLDAAPRAFRALEGLLALSAAWTLGYHLVVLLHWPAYSIAILALPLAVVALLAGGRSPPTTSTWCPGGAATPSPPPWGVYAGLVLISAAVALFTLLVNRPDSDDIAYMRRAVVQAACLRSPVLVSNVTYDANVPDVVPTQYLASYEVLIGLTGRTLHCDLLNLYFNVFAAGTALAVPWVYYLLFCAWELGPKAAVLAVLGAMLFLVLDGNTHWSPGNFAFVRLWQGKCALVTLGLPLVLLLSWRFLRRPAWTTWYPVFLSGIFAVGLSATGLFLMPGMVLVTSLAYLWGGRRLAGEPLAARCRRAFQLNLAAVYPAALALVLFTGIIPVAREVALDSDGRTWLDYLCGFGGATSLAWYAAVLLVGPWLAPPRPRCAGPDLVADRGPGVVLHADYGSLPRADPRRRLFSSRLCPSRGRGRGAGVRRPGASARSAVSAYRSPTRKRGGKTLSSLAQSGFYRSCPRSAPSPRSRPLRCWAAYL